MLPPFPLSFLSSMAVEAHHLNLFSPQPFIDRRELAKVAANHPAMLGNEQAGLTASNCSPSSFYGPTADPSDSGLTVAAAAAAVCKKRPRDPLCTFLAEDLSSHLQQQMLDLDRLLLHHTESVRAELAERRRRFTRQLAAAAEDGIRKRLKAKDDEIERARRITWALEERVRSLYAENQAWRELAQTNEAAANLLRTNLEQLLAAQLRVKEEQHRCIIDTAAVADDAESCCCGESDAPAAAPAPCRGCGEREPTVLLLPCRHLCLCPACAPATNSCPICKCSKSGSVNVNLS